MFNENSGLVKIWVRLIQSGAYDFNNVPDLSNLQDIVATVLIQENDTNEQDQKAKAFDYLIEGGLENE